VGINLLTKLYLLAFKALQNLGKNVILRRH
jgi:hypothetical protein